MRLEHLPAFNPRLRNNLARRQRDAAETGVVVVGTAYGAIKVPVHVANDPRELEAFARDRHAAVGIANDANQHPERRQAARMFLALTDPNG